MNRHIDCQACWSSGQSVGHMTVSSPVAIVIFSTRNFLGRGIHSHLLRSTQHTTDYWWKMSTSFGWLLRQTISCLICKTTYGSSLQQLNLCLFIAFVVLSNLRGRNVRFIIIIVGGRGRGWMLRSPHTLTPRPGAWPLDFTPGLHCYKHQYLLTDLLIMIVWNI